MATTALRQPRITKPATTTQRPTETMMAAIQRTSSQREHIQLGGKWEQTAQGLRMVWASQSSLP